MTVAEPTAEPMSPAYPPDWDPDALLDDGPFSRAIRFLVENYEEQPSLAEVAEVAHLSPFHFERLFKRWAGVTPKQFTQYLTLSHAKEMLADSASVLDAAHAAGLSGGSRLHDLFVAVEAVTPGEFKAAGEGVRIGWDRVATPLGDALLATTERGVCFFGFLDDDRPVAEALEAKLCDLRMAWPRAELERDAHGVAPVAEALARQLAGSSPDEGDGAAPETPVRLHLRGTNFQLQVWQALLEIPLGNAVSYGDLARSLGRPEAARAVASAVSVNPVAILIPCHRVIRSTGHMAGYRWGRGRKRALLGWESAHKVAQR